METQSTVFNALSTPMRAPSEPRPEQELASLAASLPQSMRESPRQGQPQRPAYFHTASLGFLILLPASSFMVIMIMMAFVYRYVPAVVWVVVAMSVGFSLMLMMVDSKREGPKYWPNLGGLCLLATCLAIILGLWNYYRNFSRYWAYEGQRTYLNVPPSQPAVQFLDAGKILFSENARLNFKNSFGYTDGHRFCVAPIVERGKKSNTVEYWAAGIDCCFNSDKEGREHFTCDDATDGEVHAGLVYLDFADHKLAMFKKATEEASKAYDISSSEDALFLQWVENPRQAQRVHWNSACVILVAAIFIHLGFSTCVGFCFHFRGPSKTRLKPRGV